MPLHNISIDIWHFYYSCIRIVFCIICRSHWYWNEIQNDFRWRSELMCRVLFLYDFWRLKQTLEQVHSKSFLFVEIRFQCMGTWTDPYGNIYSGLTDIGRDQYRERFRCMVRCSSVVSTGRIFLVSARLILPAKATVLT